MSYISKANLSVDVTRVSKVCVLELKGHGDVINGGPILVILRREFPIKKIPISGKR